MESAINPTHAPRSTLHAPLPAKRPLFGVHVSATTYDETVEAVLGLARAGAGGAVEFMCVHGLVECQSDPAFRDALNSFDIVATDGQPVRWAMNHFHNAGLADRVYGPECTWRLCRAAAAAGVSVYFYGSSPEVIAALTANALRAFPDLEIAGAESPPFRPLTAAEDADIVERVNASGAGLLFLGTGCPRQELFAARHRRDIRAVQLCVGAAFDLHAGVKSMAPAWMQKRGLEWLFRLAQEPRRLWKRYLVYNSIYAGMVVRESVRWHGRPARVLGRQ